MQVSDIATVAEGFRVLHNNRFGVQIKCGRPGDFPLIVTMPYQRGQRVTLGTWSLTEAVRHAVNYVRALEAEG